MQCTLTKNNWLLPPNTTKFNNSPIINLSLVKHINFYPNKDTEVYYINFDDARWQFSTEKDMTDVYEEILSFLQNSNRKII